MADDMARLAWISRAVSPAWLADSNMEALSVTGKPKQEASETLTEKSHRVQDRLIKSQAETPGVIPQRCVFVSVNDQPGHIHPPRNRKMSSSFTKNSGQNGVNGED